MRTFSLRLLVALLPVLLASGCGGTSAPEAVTLVRSDVPLSPPRPNVVHPVLELVEEDQLPEVLGSFGVDGLPDGDGEPFEAGVYAPVPESLPEGKVLVVWSSGDSSSCPTYLRSLRVTGPDDVELHAVSSGGDECTADHNAYRQLLVVDRDLLPAEGDLPLRLAGRSTTTAADDLVVARYPWSGTP